MRTTYSIVVASVVAAAACSSPEKPTPKPDEVRILPPVGEAGEQPADQGGARPKPGKDRSEDEAGSGSASSSSTDAGAGGSPSPSQGKRPAGRSTTGRSGTGTASDAERASSADATASSDSGSGTSPSATGAAPPAKRSGAQGRPRMVVDAMVGQVNGKPVYASAIFEEIGREQLERLGKSHSRRGFKKRAAQLIQSTLKEKVTNSLVLTKAENNLTEKEKKGLERMMKKERKKLLAKYKGVESSAEARLKAEKGYGLAKALEKRREELLVQKYLKEEIQPKIHVTNADVQRYYSDHYKEFNPPAKVVIRLILVSDESTAEKVAQALSKKPFKEVAKEYSEVNPSTGGKMGPYETALGDFSELRWSQLNKAVRKLEEGEVSPRVSVDIGYAWVKLVRLQKGESQPLSEVYLKIENKLRRRRFNRLSQQYMDRMLKKGNFTPIDKMGRSLLRVAMNRFAKPPKSDAGSDGA